MGRHRRGQVTRRSLAPTAAAAGAYKKVKPRLDAAKEEDGRCKERRNPSADAHEKSMSDGEALAIVTSWARAIRYRPSLTFLSCTRPPLRLIADLANKADLN
jgi:hypothetical protein